jgi:alkanesulfonate monooxygenase SsuD/methylene tetrahydromethanopterin reductase-like flavin-dependent oxidoreductase (luciferase family)
VRIGVCILPEFRWAEARPRWEAAEQGGFTTAWTYDHLSWDPLRDGPWFGALPLLTAAAAVTDRIRLGTLVISPSFRHPVPLAKELLTLDDVSGGRLDAGIGAGADLEDARVLGTPPWPRAERTARFGEFVGLLDRLLREPAVTSEGRFYSALDARQIPGCVQQPRIPFTIAAAGPRGLALAARFGEAWVTYGPWGSDASTPPAEWFAGLSAQCATVDAACREVGRSPETLRRVVLLPVGLKWAQSSVDAWEEFLGQAEQTGITDVVIHWPRPWDSELPGAAEVVLEHAAARVG